MSPTVLLILLTLRGNVPACRPGVASTCGSSSRVLLLQLVLVTLTLIVAFGLFAEFNRHRLDLQYGVHAMDIARVVASSPTVLNNIGRYGEVP